MSRGSVVRMMPKEVVQNGLCVLDEIEEDETPNESVGHLRTVGPHPEDRPTPLDRRTQLTAGDELVDLLHGCRHLPTDYLIFRRGHTVSADPGLTPPSDDVRPLADTANRPAESLRSDPMKIASVLDRIDSGAIALPEFQRGYVWHRRQVRDLVESLYRRFPIGSLLLWQTETESAPARGDARLQPGFVALLLDDQQRITSLYRLIRGVPPPFFDGDAAAFTDLRFHVEAQRFQFYAPVTMRDDPLWIDVSKLRQHGMAWWWCVTVIPTPALVGCGGSSHFRPTLVRWPRENSTML